jgi:hypothetical protein
MAERINNMKEEKLFIKLQKCKNYAKLKNGLCLSNNYINSVNKLTWQCSEGHKLETYIARLEINV